MNFVTDKELFWKTVEALFSGKVISVSIMYLIEKHKIVEENEIVNI